MGGAIRVVIRDEDGSVWSNQRWTNSLPRFTRDVRFIDNQDAWFDYYKSHDEWHNDDHTLAPIEYGIVVIDRMTKTVIDCNGYSEVLEMGVVTLLSKPDDPEYLELLRRGLLSYKGQTLVIPEGLTVEEHMKSIYQNDKWGDIEIACAPWTYILVEMDRYDIARERMKAIGLTFTARDEAAFDGYVANRQGEEDIDVEAIMAKIPETEADVARTAASTRVAE